MLMRTRFRAPSCKNHLLSASARPNSELFNGICKPLVIYLYLKSLFDCCSLPRRKCTARALWQLNIIQVSVCAHLLRELPALFYDVWLKNRLEFPERKSVKIASCWLARTHTARRFFFMECVIAYAGCVKGTRERSLALAMMITARKFWLYAHTILHWLEANRAAEIMKFDFSGRSLISGGRL